MVQSVATQQLARISRNEKSTLLCYCTRIPVTYLQSTTSRIPVPTRPLPPSSRTLLTSMRPHFARRRVRRVIMIKDQKSLRGRCNLYYRPPPKRLPLIAPLAFVDATRSLPRPTLVLELDHDDCNVCHSAVDLERAKLVAGRL
jgi:hypothetical protein